MRSLDPRTRARLAPVFAKHLALEPEDADLAAWQVGFADALGVADPKGAAERAARLTQAAATIERVVASMTMPERIALELGLASSDSRGAIAPGLRPPGGRVADFSRALRDAAQRLAEEAAAAAEAVPSAHANADRRARTVAVQVARIWTKRLGEEPPRAGAEGPFQRLLRDVFAVLGIDRSGLRGVLAAVHDSRKNLKIGH